MDLNSAQMMVRFYQFCHSISYLYQVAITFGVSVKTALLLALLLTILTASVSWSLIFKLTVQSRYTGTLSVSKPSS